MADRKNVLVVCVDHWPGLLMGAAGHDRILTPTLDQLCESGIRFSQAYSETPTCIPARRALMTGTSAKTHGDRIFNETLRMDPNLPTLPQVLGEAGYQTAAVGKLHVYPQRSRIGFDEVILHEEGRHHLGLNRDDYELFLFDEGYPGQELTHGMGNNYYTVRPWHLPERCHATNWTTKQMCRTIQRRDPDRPAFWYLSYAAPHPPVAPPQEYLDMYRDMGVDMPYIGEWAEDFDAMPYALKLYSSRYSRIHAEQQIAAARMGFYAQCTYIDHQLRLVIGTLREEGLLDDTAIIFTGDHGDLLGNHRLWAKPPMHEFSAKIPMIVNPPADFPAEGIGSADDRLAELRDIMPTVLEICGVTAPDTVEGLSLLSEERRDHLYCEHSEDKRAMRMIREDRYKLIYYPVGNRFQLFDIESDPREMCDLSGHPEYAEVRLKLEARLRGHLYGSDTDWLEGDSFVGLPEPPFEAARDRGLSAQRGWRL